MPRPIKSSIAKSIMNNNKDNSSSKSTTGNSSSNNSDTNNNGAQHQQLEGTGTSSSAINQWDSSSTSSSAAASLLLRRASMNATAARRGSNMSFNLFDLSAFPATPTGTREAIALDPTTASLVNNNGMGISAPLLMNGVSSSSITGSASGNAHNGLFMDSPADPFAPLAINEGISLTKQFEKDHPHLLLGATTGGTGTGSSTTNAVLSPLTPRTTRSIHGHILTDRSESSTTTTGGGASVPSLCESSSASSSFCSNTSTPAAGTDLSNKSRSNNINNNMNNGAAGGAMMLPPTTSSSFMESFNHNGGSNYLSPIRQQATRSMLLQDALAGRNGNGGVGLPPMGMMPCYDSPTAVSVGSSQQQQQQQQQRQMFNGGPHHGAPSTSEQGVAAARAPQVPSMDFDESQSSQQQHRRNLQAQQEAQNQEELDSQRFKPFHEEKWSLRYKELLAFHAETGHSAVPHTYPPNPQLARWVKRQRRQMKLRRDGRPSTMTADRLELLNHVGFVWDSHDVNWREKLAALELFRRQHGHCNVPSNYTDKKLATWVKCQRRQYKLYWDGKPSAMSPERIMELEKRGFEWEIRAAAPRTPKIAQGVVGAHQQEQQQQQQRQHPMGMTPVQQHIASSS